MVVIVACGLLREEVNRPGEGINIVAFPGRFLFKLCNCSAMVGAGNSVRQQMALLADLAITPVEYSQLLLLRLE